MQIEPVKAPNGLKWAQNQSFPLNRSGTIKEKHRVTEMAPKWPILSSCFQYFAWEKMMLVGEDDAGGRRCCWREETMSVGDNDVG